VTVRIAGAAGAEGEEGETLFPADPPYCRFAVNAVHADGTSLPERIIPAGGEDGGNRAALPLKDGTWTVTVTGFLDDGSPGSPFAAARGTATAVVKAGGPAEIAVALNMTVRESERQGSFAYEVQFPRALVDSAEMTLTARDGGDASLPEAAVNLLEAGRESGAVSLTPGLYRMELSLAAGYVRVSRTAALRVHPGLETAAPRYVFTDADFSPIVEYSSVAAMREGLKTLPENTPDRPYPVRLRGSDLSALENSGDTLKTMHAALAAGKRYVDLDLSGCFGASYASDSASAAPAAYVVSLTLPESVRTIGEKAFAKYKGTLTSVVMPGVTAVGWGAFSGCAKLTAVTAPELTSIDGKQNADDKSQGAFYGCTSLASVSFPLVQTVGDYAFYGCSALTAVSLPRARYIKRMAFKFCTGLQTVELPEAAAIENEAFYECPALTRIILGSTPPVLDGKRFFPTSFQTEGAIFVPPEAVSVYESKPEWSKVKDRIHSL
jgi:hypothetical protein